MFVSLIRLTNLKLKDLENKIKRGREDHEEFKKMIEDGNEKNRYPTEEMLQSVLRQIKEHAQITLAPYYAWNTAETGRAHELKARIDYLKNHLENQIIPSIENVENLLKKREKFANLIDN